MKVRKSQNGDIRITFNEEREDEWNIRARTNDIFDAECRAKGALMQGGFGFYVGRVAAPVSEAGARGTEVGGQALWHLASPSVD